MTVPETGSYNVTFAVCNNNVNYDLTFDLFKNDTKITTTVNLKSVSINKIKTEGIVEIINVFLEEDDEDDYTR